MWFTQLNSSCSGLAVRPSCSRQRGTSAMVESPSILKSTSAYDRSLESTDEQFFGTEERPTALAFPLARTDAPLEDDYDDPEGSLFSGPVARSVPTSTAAFRLRARSRGEFDKLARDLNRAREAAEDEADQDGHSVGGRSRRSSRTKRSRRGSSRRGSDATSVAVSELDASDVESLASAPSRRSTSTSHRKSSTPSSARRHRTFRPNETDVSDDEPNSSSFFQGMADVFRRRPSVSRADSTGSRPPSSRTRRRRRSSSRGETTTTDDEALSVRSESEAGDETDPYGPYGSSDTTSTDSTQTSSSQDDGPRRRRAGNFLGMPGAGDNVFGESRIEFDRSEFGSDEEESPYLTGGSPGDKKRARNAHQALYIPDEDLPLHLLGLSVSNVKLAAWRTGSVLSLGGLWLLGRWVPNVWLKSVGAPGEFDKASYIVIEVRPPSLANLSGSTNARSDLASPFTDHYRADSRPPATAAALRHFPLFGPHAPCAPGRRRPPSHPGRR